MLESAGSDRSLLGIRNWIQTSPSITPRTGVGTALRLLQEHRLPALPVIEAGQLLGMVYEKDLLRLAPSEATTLDAYELRSALDRLTVARVVRPVASLCAGISLKEALLALGAAGLEAVPVTENQRLIGLLTWPALVHAAGTELAAA